MLIAQLLIDAADFATGTAVLILKSGNHCFAEQGLVHAGEGIFQHFPKDIEAQVALLHATWIVGSGLLRKSFQQDRRCGHSRGTDA